MTVTMTLDEVKKIPPISDERLAEILAFEDTDISDCPELTVEEMSQFRIKRPQLKTGQNDYTKWQENLFEDMTVEELGQKAATYRVSMNSKNA